MDVASEFRYRDPILNENTLMIIISQSGETADTLAALRGAKRAGCRVLSVVNVVGSTIATESDDVLYTWAGPEISVASTKDIQHAACGHLSSGAVHRRAARQIHAGAAQCIHRGARKAAGAD